MSRRNKLKKFADVAFLPNVYENFTPDHPGLTKAPGEKIELRGRWSEQHFGNDHPLVLELACGRGEYTLSLARMYPGRNFIGVDIKGARIWRGAQTGLEEKLANVAFLRTRIEQVHHFFAPGEVSEIWITFPDPFPRDSKANRRLTSPSFLDLYRRILCPGGPVHLKTDADSLFLYTLEVIAEDPRAELVDQNEDIYAGELPLPELGIKTFYERAHLSEGKRIKYVRFRLE